MDAPDAHAGRLGIQIDADQAADLGADAVGPHDQVIAGTRAVGQAHPAVGGDLVHGEPVPDACPRRAHGGGQDGRQFGPVHAEGGGQVGAAGADVGDLGEQAAVGRAQPERVEPEPGRADLLPDAEVAQHPQGVALQGQARAERGGRRLELRDVHGDAGPGEQDGQGRAGRATADDEDVPYCWHAGLI
nr:hypothetical protein [Nonomuraea zeae]